MISNPSQRFAVRRPRALRAGFTLVELLTVIAIVVILAALSVGIFNFATKKGETAKAQTQMTLLDNAVQKYHAEVGVFPEGTGDGSPEESLILYSMAFGDGLGEDGVANTDDDEAYDGIPDPGATVHVPEMDPNESKSPWFESNDIPPNALLDPWGLPWRYRNGDDPNAINPDFDLWSSGPDGLSRPDDPQHPENKDDIGNW